MGGLIVDYKKRRPSGRFILTLNRKKGKYLGLHGDQVGCLEKE